MVAVLPPELEDHDSIAEMEIGQTRYTTPWAMEVDSEGQCYLRGSWQTRRKPGGTVTMRVDRTADGYCVQLVPGEKYVLGKYDVQDNFIPVLKFIEA